MAQTSTPQKRLAEKSCAINYLGSFDAGEVDDEKKPSCRIGRDLGADAECETCVKKAKAYCDKWYADCLADTRKKAVPYYGSVTGVATTVAGSLVYACGRTHNKGRSSRWWLWRMTVDTSSDVAFVEECQELDWKQVELPALPEPGSARIAE